MPVKIGPKNLKGAELAKLEEICLSICNVCGGEIQHTPNIEHLKK